MNVCAENRLETRLSCARGAGRAGFCVSAQNTLAGALCARKGSKARCQTPGETARCAGIGAPYGVGCGIYQSARIGDPCAKWRVKRPYCAVARPIAERRITAPMPTSAIRAQARSIADAMLRKLAGHTIRTEETQARVSPSRLRRVKRRYAARLAAGDVTSQAQARNNVRAIEHRRAVEARAIASAPAIGADAIRRLQGESTPGPEPRPVTADYSAVDAAEAAILRIRAPKRSAWIDAGGWKEAPLADLARYARTHWVRDLARTMHGQIEATRQITSGSYRAPVVVTDDRCETHWKAVSWQSVGEIRPKVTDTRLTGELDANATTWQRSIDSADAVANAIVVFAANTATPDPEAIAKEVSARAAETARETARIAVIRARVRTRVRVTQVRTKIIYGRAKDGRPSSTVI